MKLLKYENYTLTFEPEILTLKVFKKLHQRDKTKDKHKFIEELGFIYFYADPRSDYQIYTDEDERKKQIEEGEGLINFKLDNDIKDAIKYYTSFNTMSMLLLEDTRLLVNKFRAKMRSLEFDDLDIKDLKNVEEFMNKIPELVEDLDRAEKTVTKEIIQNENIRGSAEKAMYEDL